jgi:DinB family protein
VSDHNDRNRAARERLAAVATRLGDRNIPLSGGWTASALLAHIAFWDRLALARLEKYLRDGETPASANDAITELTNGGGMRQWLDTPPHVAARQASDAAADVDRAVAGLQADRLRFLESLGRPFLIDRSQHRQGHLDEIERALG